MMSESSRGVPFEGPGMSQHSSDGKTGTNSSKVTATEREQVPNVEESSPQQHPATPVPLSSMQLAPTSSVSTLPHSRDSGAILHITEEIKRESNAPLESGGDTASVVSATNHGSDKRKARLHFFFVTFLKKCLAVLFTALPCALACLTATMVACKAGTVSSELPQYSIWAIIVFSNAAQLVMHFLPIFIRISFHANSSAYRKQQKLNQLEEAKRRQKELELGSLAGANRSVRSRSLSIGNKDSTLFALAKRSWPMILHSIVNLSCQLVSVYAFGLNEHTDSIFPVIWAYLLSEVLFWAYPQVLIGCRQAYRARSQDKKRQVLPLISIVEWSGILLKLSTKATMIASAMTFAWVAVNVISFLSLFVGNIYPVDWLQVIINCIVVPMSNTLSRMFLLHLFLKGTNDDMYGETEGKKETKDNSGEAARAAMTGEDKRDIMVFNLFIAHYGQAHGFRLIQLTGKSIAVSVLGFTVNKFLEGFYRWSVLRKAKKKKAVSAERLNEKETAKSGQNQVQSLGKESRKGTTTRTVVTPANLGQSLTTMDGRRSTVQSVKSVKLPIMTLTGGMIASEAPIAPLSSDQPSTNEVVRTDSSSSKSSVIQEVWKGVRTSFTAATLLSSPSPSAMTPSSAPLVWTRKADNNVADTKKIHPQQSVSTTDSAANGTVPTPLLSLESMNEGDGRKKLSLQPALRPSFDSNNYSGPRKGSGKATSTSMSPHQHESTSSRKSPEMVSSGEGVSGVIGESTKFEAKSNELTNTAAKEEKHKAGEDEGEEDGSDGDELRIESIIADQSVNQLMGGILASCGALSQVYMNRFYFHSWPEKDALGAWEIFMFCVAMLFLGILASSLAGGIFRQDGVLLERSRMIPFIFLVPASACCIYVTLVYQLFMQIALFARSKIGERE